MNRQPIEWNDREEAVARNSQVSRILRVLHFLDLNPQGLAARDIRAKLEDIGIKCSRETIYKDLKALEASGIPVVNEGKAESAVWKLETLVKVSRGISFAYNEIIALYIARESLKALEHSPLYDAIESFFMKLEKLMGPKCHEAIESMSKSISVKTSPAWATNSSREIITTVQASCEEGHVLEIDYQSVSGDSAGQIVTRRVGPHHMYFADNGSYLVAKDLKDGVIKTFALPRVKRAVMTDEAFGDAHFSPDEYFRNAMGVLGLGDVESVEIHIAEPMATYISERRLHPSQRTIRRENGVVLSLDVKINDELVRWILGLGPEATVQQPLHLKELVADAALRITSKYERPKAS